MKLHYDATLLPWCQTLDLTLQNSKRLAKLYDANINFLFIKQKIEQKFNVLSNINVQ